MPPQKKKKKKQWSTGKSQITKLVQRYKIDSLKLVLAV